jgi:hypothetical protein
VKEGKEAADREIPAVDEIALQADEERVAVFVKKAESWELRAER